MCNITTIITRCLRSLVQVFDVRLSVEQIAFKRAVPLNLKGILICPVLAGGGGTLPGINRGVVYEKRTMQPFLYGSCRRAHTGSPGRSKPIELVRKSSRAGIFAASGRSSIQRAIAYNYRRRSPRTRFLRIQLSIPRIHRVPSVVSFFYPSTGPV